MLSSSELIQILHQFASYEDIDSKEFEHLRIHSYCMEDLGIALRTKTPSFHLYSTVTKHRKLMQQVNSCLQSIEDVWNFNNNVGLFFVPKSVPSRKKFPIYLLIALLLFASCDEVHCRSNRTPQNVAQRIGERVIMSCAANDTENPCQNVFWTHYAAHTLSANVIWMGDNISPLVSQYISISDSNDGKCTLEIKTQASAAGKYECLSTTTHKKASASLIILAGDPECLVEKVVDQTGEYSNITCQVKYFGDWAPTMEWITMTEQSIISINSSRSYTSDQIVGTNLMVPLNDPSFYRCFMKFTKQGRKTKTTATNVPHYEWTSPIFGEYEGEARRRHGIMKTMYAGASVGQNKLSSLVYNGLFVITSLFLWLLLS